MKDDLGNRIKEQYENRTRHFLPRRTYTIIRIDGKAFHTFTRNCIKPFDNNLIELMNYTCKSLCERLQGCKFGYVQSDEISLLLTDFEDIRTQAWFDGNIQKIVSISASIATEEFNRMLLSQMAAIKTVPEFVDTIIKKEPLFANFDSRVFTIPDPVEVSNYFIWRQQDASRNSIQMLARSLYSHKECENKNTSELQEMCFQKGQNWDKLDTGLKRGRGFVKEFYEVDSDIEVFVTRSRWVNKELPIFTQDREFLKKLLPTYD